MATNVNIKQGTSMWRADCECGWTDYMWFTCGQEALMEMVKAHVKSEHPNPSPNPRPDSDPLPFQDGGR